MIAINKINVHYTISCGTVFDNTSNTNIEGTFMANVALSSQPLSNSNSALLKESTVIPLLGAIVVLVIMNTMMFNLALPTVALEFKLTSTAASWIATGYSIVFAISSITYSRLSDFVPIRVLLTISLVCLGGASILGYFSHHFIVLLCARIIQASGAGSVKGLAIVLITRYVPLSRRGKAIALITSATSLGFGLGPVAGGVITEYLGWNVLFLVTACTLLLIPVVYRLLPKETFAAGSFDWISATLVGLGSTGLLLSLTNRMPAALVVGLLALALFWIRISRVSDPFVQPTLFRNKRYMLLSLLGIISYINNFALLFLLPQLLAHLYGLTPAQSGLIIFPGALLSMLASSGIGRIIDRLGTGLLLRYAPVLLMVSGILFALFSDRSYYAVMLIYILTIVGFSALSASVSVEISRVLPKTHIGAGMGLFQLTQFFSGAFSVAASSSVLMARSGLPLSPTYSLIFWGMAGIGILAVICSYLYRRSKAPLDQR